MQNLNPNVVEYELPVEGAGGESGGNPVLPKPGDPNFTGPLTQQQNHFINGDGIGPKQKGVLGAHNMESFDKTLASTGFKPEDLKIG